MSNEVHFSLNNGHSCTMQVYANVAYTIIDKIDSFLQEFDIILVKTSYFNIRIQERFKYKYDITFNGENFTIKGKKEMLSFLQTKMDDAIFKNPSEY